jgi:hypothetical protein
MINILISLPQLEWSCFLLSHIKQCILKKYSNINKIDVISKNIMDEDMFPHVINESCIIGMLDLKDAYDYVYNFDSDILIDKILSKKYGKVINLQNCIYGDENIWNNISNFFSVNIDEPKFKFNIVNRTRLNKAESGVAIKNNHLRSYVKKSFFVDNSRLWHVPVRKNLYKRFDECNTVSNLVTDDIFCALSGYAQNKKVVFLNLYEEYYNISCGENLYIQGVGDYFKWKQSCIES